MRRPFGCRRADLARALPTAAAAEGLSTMLGRAGVTTEIVPSAPWNIKITTAEDWALARAIEQCLHPV